jgi:hypothetical protein
MKVEKIEDHFLFELMTAGACVELITISPALLALDARR